MNHVSKYKACNIKRQKRWVKDISFLFSNNYNAFDTFPKFCRRKSGYGASKAQFLDYEMNGLSDIKNVPIGVINLNKGLSIDKVTKYLYVSKDQAHH